jgi:hypothetical protein
MGIYDELYCEAELPDAAVPGSRHEQAGETLLLEQLATATLRSNEFT